MVAMVSDIFSPPSYSQDAVKKTCDLRALDNFRFFKPLYWKFVILSVKICTKWKHIETMCMVKASIWCFGLSSLRSWGLDFLFLFICKCKLI